MQLPYYPRWLNKWYANIFGYFWCPCPICGNMFGGHEWKTLGYSSLRLTETTGEGICPKCSEQAIRSLKVI